MWSQLFTLASSFAGDPKTIISILKVLLDIQSQELRLLQQMGNDIQSLREGPFNTAHIYLDEALRHTEVKQRRKSIEKAKDKFMDALGIEHNSLPRRALIQYRIGICWSLLNNAKFTQLWHERAFQSADEAVQRIYNSRRVGIENLKLHDAGLYRPIDDSGSIFSFIKNLPAHSASAAAITSRIKLKNDIGPMIELMDALSLLSENTLKIDFRFNPSDAYFEIRQLIEKDW